MEKFRFYCQKVLPLVYDDSLSYYELLCKVVDKLNGVIEQSDRLSNSVADLYKALDELKNYVNHYFDNLVITNEINAKLDKMAESGFFNKILLENLWNANKEELANYRVHARKCMASYLAYSYGTGSVVSDIPIANKVCWEYSTNYGYMGLFGRYASFKTDVTEEINGSDYPVCYADCSVFTSLITKGIQFKDSPYYYKIVEKGTDTETLYRKALEYGTIKDYPFTFDWLNNLNTDTMALIQEKAGIPVIMISERPYQNAQALYYDEMLSTLETGDILYRGVEGNNNYRGINHCGTFVKKLEDLIRIENFETHIVSINKEVSNYGYIVEVSGSLDETKYGNVLRISTIEEWTNYGDGSVQVYSAKPISCMLTSNKSNSELTGILHCYDWDVNVLQERTEDGGYIVASVSPKQSGGVILQANTDLNDLVYDGQYYVPNQATLDTIGNSPTTTQLYVISCYGFVKARTYGFQVARCYSTSSPNIYIRGKANGTWSEWKKLSKE